MAALRSVVSDRAFRLIGAVGICLALTLGLSVQASLAQQSSAKQAKVKGKPAIVAGKTNGKAKAPKKESLNIC